MLGILMLLISAESELQLNKFTTSGGGGIISFIDNAFAKFNNLVNQANLNERIFHI